MKLQKRLEPVIEKFNERFYNVDGNFVPYRKNSFWAHLIDKEKQKRIFIYLVKQTDVQIDVVRSYFMVENDDDTYWMTDMRNTNFPQENWIVTVRCGFNATDVFDGLNLKHINVQHEKELLELIDEL